MTMAEENLISLLEIALKSSRANASAQIDLIEKMAERKLKYTWEVLNAKDAETGKPLYTNEQSREMAIKSKTEEDAEYPSWKEALRTAKERQLEADDGVKLLEWKLKFALAGMGYRG